MPEVTTEGHLYQQTAFNNEDIICLPQWYQVRMRLARKCPRNLPSLMVLLVLTGLVLWFLLDTGSPGPLKLASSVLKTRSDRLSSNTSLVFMSSSFEADTKRAEAGECLESNQCLTHFSELTELGDPELGGGIPAVVHYLYKDKYIPMEYKWVLDRCVHLHPRWKFILWTDNSMAAYVKAQPIFSQRLKEIYLEVQDSGERAHLSRLLLMMGLGGVYLDMDMHCVKRLDGLFQSPRSVSCLLDRKQPMESKVIFNRELVVMDNVLACVPGHPFFKMVLDLIGSGEVYLEFNNPLFLTNMLTKYRALSKSKTHPVLIAEPNWFSPLLGGETAVGEACRARMISDFHRIKGCQEWYERFGGKKFVPRTEMSYLIHKHFNFNSATYHSRHTMNVCAHFLNMFMCRVGHNKDMRKP